MTKDEYNALIFRWQKIQKVFDSCCEKYKYGNRQYVCHLCNISDGGLLEIRSLNDFNTSITGGMDIKLFSSEDEMGIFMFLCCVFQTSYRALNYFYATDVCELCWEDTKGNGVDENEKLLVFNVFANGDNNIMTIPYGGNTSFHIKKFDSIQSIADFVMEKLLPTFYLLKG